MCSEWSAWKVRMGRLMAMDLILRSNCFCSGRSNGSIVSGSSGWCWEWADVSSRLNTARGAGRSGPPQWVAHSSTSKALCPLVGLIWYSLDSLVLCKCFHLCHDGKQYVKIYVRKLLSKYKSCCLHIKDKSNLWYESWRWCWLRFWVKWWLL